MPYPVIGITQSSSLHYSNGIASHLASYAYYQAVLQAGGFPIAINKPPIPDLTGPNSSIPDAILFSGGGDVNPTIYGDQADDLSLQVDDERDAIELTWLKMAINRNLPILGICRGFQLINVALGGKLYHDLALERENGLEHNWSPSRRYLAHQVNLEPLSTHNYFGATKSLRVNSLHHQGICKIGDHIKIIAYAEDGLIEAFELTGHCFGLAVQWHPEWLTDQAASQSVFTSFINACA